MSNWPVNIIYYIIIVVIIDLAASIHLIICKVRPLY